MSCNYGGFFKEYQGNCSYNADKTFDLDEILDFYVHQPPQQPEKEEKETAETGNFDEEEITEDLTDKFYEERSYTCIQTKCQIPDVGKGGDKKNLNLNKFVHHQTLIYLKGLQKCKVLSAEEIDALEKYGESGNSFQTHYQLFKDNQSLKNRCLQFYESSEFINKILTGKTSFQRKISILKFLEQIKQCIGMQEPKKRWNDHPL